MISKNRNKALITAVSVILLTFISILYFVYFDQKYYLKDILKNSIMLAVPLPYLFLILLFIALSSIFLKKDIKTVTYPIIAMAMALPLLYLLTELRIGLINGLAFGGNRGVYGVYAVLYYVSAISGFAIFSGLLLRRSAKDDFLYLPVFICFLIIETMLYSNKLILSASIFLALFVVSYSSAQFRTGFLSKIKDIFVKFVRNEKLFLLTIFIIALAVRYFWGIRMLTITGAKFVMGSDDGITYEPFASMIATGKIIPEQDAFLWNGFGYWHFLAWIYRIFGLHNFKAVIAVQSILGASVPVMAYLMAKRIFATRFVPVLVSVMTTMNLTLVFLSVVIGMEALYIPLFILAMTVMVYFMTGSRFDYKKAFIIGALFGLANLARTELLSTMPILAFLIFIFMRGKSKAGGIFGAIASLFLGFLLLVSIQHVTNQVIYGRYSIAPSASLEASFGGDFAGIKENQILDSLGFNPFRSMTGSISVFLKNPVMVSKLIASGGWKRFMVFFLKPNFGVFDPVYLVNPGSGYFFRFAVWVQLYEYVFIFAGIIAALRRRDNLIAKIALLAVCVSISFIYCLIIATNSRHRGSLIPVFIIFFVYGVYIFCKKVKNAYAGWGR